MENMKALSEFNAAKQSTIASLEKENAQYRMLIKSQKTTIGQLQSQLQK